MSRRPRRAVEIFSLSFLDVVSCGFGAIVLLLVIVKVTAPAVIEQDAVDLTEQVRLLERQQQEIRGATAVLERELIAVREQTSPQKEKLARLIGELSELQGRFRTTRLENEAQTRIERQLETAHQALSEEMRRLLGASFRRPPDDATIGGVPVDSEYVVFIVDTSGSMRGHAWPAVLKTFSEVLAIYPGVKGIQVMNDMGEYLFSSYQGRWIPDSPARRRAIMQRLADWQPFSNSSPVEGIEAAIRRFYAPGRRISLYVFGDDFSRGSIQSVLDEVSRLNARGQGRSLVRIHAVGFPVQFLQGGLPANAIRFAALMRRLAETNHGSFVGLSRLGR